MTIKTKFDPGDTISYVSGGRLVEAVVEQASANADLVAGGEPAVSVFYRVSGEGGRKRYVPETNVLNK